MNSRAWALSTALVLAACGSGGRGWQDSFALEKCTHSTVGKNRYWILEPGYQVVLASNSTQVAITVLDATETVNGIQTRVIEEREFENGKLKEVSRNWFTICREHGDVFYHGEDVDDYKDGKVVGHGGSWRAGVKGARAGLMMPAEPTVGYKHYQEVAPGVALDRAEIVSLDVTFDTPAGEFKNCLQVVETTPLESGKCVKIYAPDVGLASDDDMVIVQRGHGKKPPTEPYVITANLAGAVAEVEIREAEMPRPVADALKKLHPTGKVKEVKRETHPGGKTLYAIEIMVDGHQHDVELAPDGKVLKNQKE